MSTQGSMPHQPSRAPITRRPWTVVAAAAIAIVMAVLQLLAAWTYHYMSGCWAHWGRNWVSSRPGSDCNREIPGYRFLKYDFPHFAASAKFFELAAAAGVILAGLLIWGAVAALRRKKNTILIAAAVSALVVDVALDLIITKTYGYLVLHVILAVVIVVLASVRTKPRSPAAHG